MKKRYLYTIGIILCSVGTLAQTTTDSINNTLSLADSIINYGMMFLKTPYRYGSDGTTAFDCSGFTSHVFGKFGYKLAHSSASQAHQFSTISRQQIKKGDLVFFEGRSHNGNVGHVGIVVSTDSVGNFKFLHAARSGVIITKSDEEYYKPRYLKAGRVLPYADIFPTDSLQFTEQDVIPADSLNLQSPTPEAITYITYIVKKGDTLYSIAHKHHISISDLKSLNRLNGDVIKIGQKLTITAVH